MKRRALFVCLLILLTFSIQARVSYQPSVSASFGGTFTYKMEDMIRSSLSGKIELDPLALQINDRHVISLPIHASYTSRTPYFDGYCLNSHTDMGIGISYRYRVNDQLSLRTVADMNLRLVMEVHGGIYTFGLTMEPWLNLNRKIALTIPLRVGFTKGEISFSPGIGIAIVPFGDRL